MRTRSPEPIRSDGAPDPPFWYHLNSATGSLNRAGPTIASRPAIRQQTCLVDRFLPYRKALSATRTVARLLASSYVLRSILTGVEDAYRPYRQDRASHGIYRRHRLRSRRSAPTAFQASAIWRSYFAAISVVSGRRLAEPSKGTRPKRFLLEPAGLNTPGGGVIEDLTRDCGCARAVRIYVQRASHPTIEPAVVSCEEGNGRSRNRVAWKPVVRRHNGRRCWQDGLFRLDLGGCGAN